MQKSLAFLEALSDASPVDPQTLNYSQAVRLFFMLRYRIAVVFSTQLPVLCVDGHPVPCLLQLWSSRHRSCIVEDGCAD